MPQKKADITAEFLSPTSKKGPRVIYAPFNPAVIHYIPLLAILFVLIFNLPAHADTIYDTGFTIVVSEVRSLTLDAENAALTPGGFELISGWTQEQTWDIDVSANCDWVLQIRGTDPTWDGPWPKPVGDIFFSCNGTDYMPLATTPSEVVYGGPSNRESYPVNFKVALDPLLDIPGEYFYGYIVFELETP